MSQTTVDFRKNPQFVIDNVADSGIYLGKKIYPKLYTVENIYRTIIHSILSVQTDPNWWPMLTPPPIQRKAQKFKDNYIVKSSHTIPGEHYIYFTDLNDLNEITRINSGFFIPVIPTIDDWVLKIENMRLPRNVVAHMNFPSKKDQEIIENIHADFKALVKNIQNMGNIVLKAPK